MKLFTGADLIIYFFIYGLLAWIINTAIYSLKEQKYVSTGVLGIPILGVPAILMTIMIIVSSGKNVSYYGMLLMAFIDYLILEKLGLTLALSRVKRQNNISIFISGFFFGGVFEYLCSVFTEVFFGMKFWDYSYMPFNIDGRTNLLFMFFWGIVALVWFRFIYPPLSKTIEKIPPITGTVLAFIITAFFVCNGIVTSMVMIRTTGRKEQPVARNVIEQFIDDEYPNDVVRKLWPNMDFLEE